MTNGLFWRVGLLGILGLFGAYASPSYGQNVVADGTVGTIVSGNAPFTVTGGSQQLTTLFHSFQDFSPQTADVLFQLDGNQSAVNIVISRVTGTNLSFIDGQLQLVGGNNPDLFFINPNGITFGANAKLSLPGSFFASTAESILFNGGLSFSSRFPGDPPLLSVSVPIGLQFGTVARPITVEQGELAVNARESLGFLGGNLQFTGSDLSARGGNLALGSVTPGSQVTLNADTFFMDYSNVTSFQDITLDQGTSAEMSGNSGGKFQVQGRNIRLLDNSVLRASNLGPSDGGTVTVRASDQLEVTGTNANMGFRNTSAIFANVAGEGRGNYLVIEADQLLISQGAYVTTDTFATGASGGITIDAKDIFIVGSPDANEGDTILSSSTFDMGQGGNIDVTAERLIAQGSLFLFVDAYEVGNGGDLKLNVGELVLQSGAQIGTGTFGDGNSGDLTVVATESVEITGFKTFSENKVFSTGLFSSAEPDSTGNAGNLSITTPRLSIVQGGKVAVNTIGEGNGGNITIRADEIEVADPIVDFTGAISGLVANAVGGSTGSGGSLDIEANRLRVYDGGQITASTNGTGNAGTVMIRADEIDVSGQSRDGMFRSEIVSGSKTRADAGSVHLTGDQITVRDGAGISVDSLNGGAAGNLTISTERLYLNNGTLEARVTGGNEGNLQLTATEAILMRQNSQIVTSASGIATGGNISLSAPVIVGLENSDVVANAVFGSGGNIVITTQGLFGLVFREELTPDNDITASSRFGLNGTVAINNFNIQPDAGLVELPVGLTDTSNQVAQGCTGGRNQFIVTGRGGVPVTPTDTLEREHVWTDTRDLTPFVDEAFSSSSLQPASSRLAEATNWYTNKAGAIELIAYSFNAETMAYASCSDAPTSGHRDVEPSLIQHTL